MSTTMKLLSSGFLIVLCSQLCFTLSEVEGSTSDNSQEQSNEIQLSYKSLMLSDDALVGKSQTGDQLEKKSVAENAVAGTLNLQGSSHNCVHKPTGLYADFDSKCKNYYACISGLDYVYDYNCEPGFRFSREACTCLPSRVVDCHTPLPEDTLGCRERPLPRPTPQSTSTTPSSDFCVGKGPGYYSDISRGCEWFFVCFGGQFQTTQFRCPSHLRFSHFTCRCEYPFAVACTVLDAEPCYPHEHHHGGEVNSTKATFFLAE